MIIVTTITEQQTTRTHAADNGRSERELRPLGRAMWRGVLCRCPNCGKGRLYPVFLEQTEQCGACGERLGHYRVGLLLSFAIVMIVAHLAVFVMLEMEMTGLGSAGLYLSVLIPLCIVVPIALMRPLKGAIIGFLWARNLSDDQMTLEPPNAP